jgi:hypothetical protein
MRQIIQLGPVRNEALISYVFQTARVACDRRCDKAWGINNRPRVDLSSDPDDYAFLADSELGTAPADPGTYEGGCAKPSSPDEFPQKWCVRECERSVMSMPGEWDRPIEVPSFENRDYNMPHLHPEAP